MDEPDAPLSFVASLGLAGVLHDLATAGSQVVVATHSPVLSAVPGANLLELGPWASGPRAGKTSAWWWPGGSSCVTLRGSSGTCSRRD